MVVWWLATVQEVASLFQYSLCRVVLMVLLGFSQNGRGDRLSVLALSSRFDGRSLNHYIRNRIALSVLALSSRFDGRGPGGGQT